MKIFVFSLWTAAVAMIAVSPLPALSFTENEFEDLVRSENAELKALYEQKKALSTNTEEADTIYGWQLIGGVNRRLDKRPSDNPSFSYESLNSTGAQLGFQKIFSFGLESRISLNSTQTEIVNGNAGTGNFSSKTWETQPALDLKLPLLAGGFGKKVRADYQLLLLSKKREALEAETAYDSKMNEAKILLWSTILQKEQLQSQAETLTRIQKIFDIVRKKAALNLEASSNFLQTRSALEQAELELKSSQLRYSQLERLLKIVLSKETSISVPAYNFSKFRKVDYQQYSKKVMAQEKLLSLSEDFRNQSAILNTELNRSRLDLVASMSLSGQDQNWNEAFRESQKGQYPTQFVGLQWIIPLDQASSSRTIDRQELISKTSLAKKAYYQTEQREGFLQDLVEQINQMIDMLALNINLEKTQAEKLKNERQLLNQGRSSIYQVLQFELDLARAQAGKYSLAIELEKKYQLLSQYRYNSYE